jgi:hypothetical protein
MDGRMSDKHADLLQLARERRDEAEAADERNRDRSADDLKFLIGDQWPEEIRAAREEEGKPCLTINGLPQFVRQVTGQIRQLNPAIKVVAADGQASEDVAEVIGGLIRQIENQADAASIYEQAAESAAACGIGNFRVRSDYCDGDTFDQELLIERVHNPFAVFWDPMAKHPTRMDAGFCFIAEEMKRDDFTEAYPDAQADDISSEHHPDRVSRWYSSDTVVVAEYYWIEHEEHTIGLLPDGQIVRDPVAPMNVIRKRTVREPRVKWAKITGHEVLEGPVDVPGRFIPVFAVTGEEWHLGEEMYRSSVIRFAKDPQQLYNYSRSAHAETVALQPKAPYIVTARQVMNLEKFWNEANKSNRPYLPYNADEKAPPPQRSTPPVPSSGLLQEISLAGEDMKRTTGIYDASLGARSNETSGVAIQQRQQESQLGSSIYADNMVKAIHQCGKVMVDMIPAVYDTQRVIRILGENDQEKMVVINGMMQSQDGIVPVNDLQIGKYDVRISVGPSYDTKREESRAGMMDFLRAYPPAAQVTADLVAKAQDWPDADQFAERLRKQLPPGMISPEDMTDEERQQAEQEMQQQQQMQQMMQQIEMAKIEASVRKGTAEAGEAESDAQKAALDVAEAQLELAAKNGQLNQIIQAHVAHALQTIMAQGVPMQQQPMQPQGIPNGPPGQF